MDSSTIKILGSIGGFCFFVSALFNGLFAYLGFAIGVYLFTLRNSFPNAKTHSLIVMIGNGILILLQVLLMLRLF